MRYRVLTLVAASSALVFVGNASAKLNVDNGGINTTAPKDDGSGVPVVQKPVQKPDQDVSTYPDPDKPCPIGGGGGPTCAAGGAVVTPDLKTTPGTESDIPQVVSGGDVSGTPSALPAPKAVPAPSLATQKTIKRYAALTDSGDAQGALALARQQLALNPGDRSLQALVAAGERRLKTEATVKDRAKELLAGLRGDAGDVPPGAGVTDKPELASAIGFPGFAGRGAMTPAQLAAANAQAAREGGTRLSDPLVRSAVSEFTVGDLDGAKSLLDKRLADTPSDESALRFRALVLRRQGKYQPSAADAKDALGLAPWDTRAHRALIDDMVDLGHPEQALEEAERALKEYPRDAELYAARADAHGALGQRAEELADLRQAAALDAAFDALYKERAAAPAAAASRRPNSTTVWLGAVGTALLFFSFVIFRKRGESSVRLAMRAEDHEVLARGARPAAVPAGFQVLRTLGQGGMGVVYEAMDVGLQRPVALKKLRAEVADSPRERERFLKEARTVAALKHPNIVEIHAIHEDAEGLFLVFEKVSGETLHDRLGRGALPPAEAVSVLRQVGRALDYAHQAGVVHQDLKPANVMVAEGGFAKVMDFGIARRVAETMSALSKVEVAGTPAYMAPEQERGGGAGPSADVFALGACAYELLTGSTPFPTGGLMMKMERMYRPLAESAPGLPPAVDAAIARALDPDPAQRWPTASSFVEALARSLAVPA